MSHLFEDYNMYKVLNIFLNDPIKDFQLREISRDIKLHHKTVSFYVKQLLKLKLVKLNTSALYKNYSANTENPMFKRYKKIINLIKIYESGLVDYLYEKIMPNCIVLFGGYAKGTDTKKSDMDLFIEAKEEEIKLGRFEEKLNRRIHLMFEEDVKGLSKELKNNIINGVVLIGSLRVFK